MEDPEAFLEMYKEITEKTILMQFEANGMSREYVNQAFLESTGMTFDEYLDLSVKDLDVNEVLEEATVEGVYYVGQNGIYIAESWNEEFRCNKYTLENGVLTLEPYEEIEYVDEPMILTKVEEEN